MIQSGSQCWPLELTYHGVHGRTNVLDTAEGFCSPTIFHTSRSWTWTYSWYICFTEIVSHLWIQEELVILALQHEVIHACSNGQCLVRHSIRHRRHLLLILSHIQPSRSQIMGPPFRLPLYKLQWHIQPRHCQTNNSKRRLRTHLILLSSHHLQRPQNTSQGLSFALSARAIKYV